MVLVGLAAVGFPSIPLVQYLQVSSVRRFENENDLKMDDIGDCVDSTRKINASVHYIRSSGSHLIKSNV